MDPDLNLTPALEHALIAFARRYFRRYFRNHGRSLPWRLPETSPFGILTAEMLLRQTRAEQVSEIWEQFVSHYPDPAAVTQASRQELYELVSPLGLGQQRVNALAEVSHALIAIHGGKVPRSVSKLVELPHVGLYAAHAVACFAFGKRAAIVDVNVLRVLSRLFGETYRPDNRRAPLAWKRAELILPKSGSVKEHNYGLLDFAATICKPRDPQCSKCALRKHCNWYAETHISILGQQ